MLSAVGTIFYTEKTHRCLFLLRAGIKHCNTWGLVGGKIEKNESTISALHREIIEEIGFLPTIKKYIPIETFTSNDQKFEYQTFICIVEREFIPQLNHEHSGFCWANIKNWPKPLHPGLLSSLTLPVIQNKIQTIDRCY